MKFLNKFRFSFITLTWFILTCCGELGTSIDDCGIRIKRTDTTVPICVNKIPDQDVLGSCYFYKTKPELNYIRIDVDKIEKRGISLELIMLHEIGHCEYSLGHKPTEYLEDGCAKWVMASFYPNTATSEACYNTHEDYYKSQFNSFKMAPKQIF